MRGIYSLPPSHMTVLRTEPACGTCRKKSRKCDRKRPICDRCRIKGLHCEGYPPRFQFREVLVAPSRQWSTGVVSSSDPLALAEPALEPPTAPQTANAVTPPVDFSVIESFDNCLPDSAEDLLPQDPSISSHSSPSSPENTQIPANQGSYASPPIVNPQLQNEVIANQPIIEYFQQTLSQRLMIQVHGIENPFQKYVLPLAYQHQGILHALLGLSVCHMHISGRESSHYFVAASFRYRLSALHSLGSLLQREEASRLEPLEAEYVLAMVLLLVLHDVCETGVSSHGAHLNGVSFLCKRMACSTDCSTRSKAGMFFTSALAWLDILRGFSGAEKLSYSEDIRSCVRDHGSLSLHTLVGCPPSLFYEIGQVLEAGKANLAGDIPLEQFKDVLQKAEKFFRTWDPEQVVYPTSHGEWKHLADAYRHACLLRIMRFPDPLALSCEDTRIKASVSAILDICAAIPRDSTFYKRLLFPLFLAGADTCSPHQIHYASWCISGIKEATGFQHPALTKVLARVWDERQGTDAQCLTNVSWTEFTCSEQLKSQHAYLFF
ncbi:fungal-specific transcription factor domain-containing protein [Fusarium tricinctum]|uniref:Fungal-specific transcription factor domain-containing protein n=1 Tax=Fusarium tricinctum TaxID=61284 RepID=A0A8K0S9N8_9HYPO|nr:fungal-specific transcription factor domain-containing protein [Fusarium tricinctum]